MNEFEGPRDLEERAVQRMSEKDVVEASAPVEEATEGPVGPRWSNGVEQREAANRAVALAIECGEAIYGFICREFEQDLRKLVDHWLEHQCPLPVSEMVGAAYLLAENRELKERVGNMGEIRGEDWQRLADIRADLQAVGHQRDDWQRRYEQEVRLHRDARGRIMGLEGQLVASQRCSEDLKRRLGDLADHPVAICNGCHHLLRTACVCLENRANHRAEAAEERLKGSMRHVEEARKILTSMGLCGTRRDQWLRDTASF